MKFSKKVTAIATMVAAGFATNVAAETASDNINVYAGLAPVLELMCSDVKFGVWRVPVGSRTGGATTITLTDGGSGATEFAIGGSTTGVAVSGAAEAAAPALGSCAFTGSVADAGETAMGVSMATTVTGASTDDVGSLTGGTMVAAGADEYAGLAAPETVNTGLGFTLSFEPATAISVSGEGSFKIAGILTIPDNIVAGNYGGYKQDGTITVTINDEN